MDSPLIRPDAAEDDLARRIAAEREQRGWSYADMAERMTEVGCPMAQTTVFKSEKGSPRRKVTVRELVGFARVFGLSVEELLTPRDLSPEAQAKRLLAELADPWSDVFEGVSSIGLRLESLAGLELDDRVDPRPQLLELVEYFEAQSFFREQDFRWTRALRHLVDELVETYLGVRPDLTGVSGEHMLEDEGGDRGEHREEA